MSAVGSSIEMRATTPADRDAVLDLLAVCLGWSTDVRYRDFFAWKHDQNPFGRSPGWVAVDAGEIIGFRTFLRWEHQGPDGAVHRTVRAVDTATHPSYRGQGVFRRLTLHALDDLRVGGESFVFNTPNERSRPGYLKMGWTALGRLPAEVRMTSLTSTVRMLRSRVAAGRWSLPSALGHDASDVLADPELEELLQVLPPPRGLHTRLTPAYLRWRYGFEPLAYRALTVSDGVAEASSCSGCDAAAPPPSACCARSSCPQAHRTSADV